MPRYITEFIFYGWALYFFIKQRDYKQFKTWVSFLIGVGLILCGKIIAIYLYYLQSNAMDIDISKVDGFLAIPLFIGSIIIIAKLLNKKDKLRAEDRERML